VKVVLDLKALIVALATECLEPFGMVHIGIMIYVKVLNVGYVVGENLMIVLHVLFLHFI